MDIVFVLDESGSVGRSNFQKEFEFVAKFTSSFDIGPSQMQFGLITFSTDARTHMYLNTFSDKVALTNHIRQIPYNSGDTNTANAMQMAQYDLFTPQHGDRLNAKNIMIVITDGLSQHPGQTTIVANQLRAAGIQTIAVGVGPNVNLAELKVIASDPRHVFTVPRFYDLPAFQNPLRYMLCQGEFKGNKCRKS